MRTRSICYVEHLVDGVWRFHCYLINGAQIPGRLGHDRAGSAWVWARKLVKEDPDHWRIIGEDVE